MGDVENLFRGLLTGNTEDGRKFVKNVMSVSVNTVTESNIG